MSKHDFGVQVPHCAVSAYVVGQRRVDNEVTFENGEATGALQLLRGARRAV